MPIIEGVTFVAHLGGFAEMNEENGVELSVWDWQVVARNGWRWMIFWVELDMEKEMKPTRGPEVA